MAELRTNSSAAVALMALKTARAEIDKMITYGPLPGTGRDEQAQRNGIILASNAIGCLIGQAEAVQTDDTGPAHLHLALMAAIQELITMSKVCGEGLMTREVIRRGCLALGITTPADPGPG